MDCTDLAAYIYEVLVPRHNVVMMIQHWNSRNRVNGWQCVHVSMVKGTSSKLRSKSWFMQSYRIHVMKSCFTIWSDWIFISSFLYILWNFLCNIERELKEKSKAIFLVRSTQCIEETLIESSHVQSLRRSYSFSFYILDSFLFTKMRFQTSQTSKDDIINPWNLCISFIALHHDSNILSCPFTIHLRFFICKIA